MCESYVYALITSNAGGNVLNIIRLRPYLGWQPLSVAKEPADILLITKCTLLLQYSQIVNLSDFLSCFNIGRTKITFIERKKNVHDHSE